MRLIGEILYYSISRTFLLIISKLFCPLLPSLVLSRILSFCHLSSLILYFFCCSLLSALVLSYYHRSSLILSSSLWFSLILSFSHLFSLIIFFPLVSCLILSFLLYLTLFSSLMLIISPKYTIISHSNIFTTLKQFSWSPRTFYISKNPSPFSTIISINFLIKN